MYNDQNRASYLEILYDIGILDGDSVAKLGTRSSSFHACSVNQIFQADWNSVKWSAVTARLNFRLCLLGFHKRRFSGDRDERVQRRIEPCNNIEALVN